MAVSDMNCGLDMPAGIVVKALASEAEERSSILTSVQCFEPTLRCSRLASSTASF